MRKILALKMIKLAMNVDDCDARADTVLSLESLQWERFDHHTTHRSIDQFIQFNSIYYNQFLVYDQNLY